MVLPTHFLVCRGIEAFNFIHSMVDVSSTNLFAREENERLVISINHDAEAKSQNVIVYTFMYAFFSSLLLFRVFHFTSFELQF